MSMPNIGMMPSLSGAAVNLKVTPEILAAKSSETANQVKAMRQHMEQLQTLIDKTRAYWIGEAADKHRQMYHDLQEDTEEILNRLGEHPVDLVAIAQRYADVELKIQLAVEELPGDVIV